MNTWSHSDEELDRYFEDPTYRHDSSSYKARGKSFLQKHLNSPKKRQAVVLLGAIVGVILAGFIVLLGFFLALDDENPSSKALENPSLDLATVAYTADGEVLARYALHNRSWMPFDSISQHVVHALISTEDHRFRSHWGIDLQGIMAAVFQLVTTGDLRGASTISQQLARNLYNEQIGREVTLTRKVKEMLTAVELERRYTKQEILEMYLNTVSFGHNQFGVGAAARTFYDKDAGALTALEAATLIGILKAPTYYSAVMNPDRARLRRNVVLRQMVTHGHLTEEFYQTHNDDPVAAEYNSSAIRASLAPYFAEYVRNWLTDWGRANDHNIYVEGLKVYTTLDSELQQIARESVEEQATMLQNVVDTEWSRSSFGGYPLSTNIESYDPVPNEEAFDYYWNARDQYVNAFIRESVYFEQLVDEGLEEEEALAQLRDNESFMDSLKVEKTTLQAGFVAINPRNGHVRAWVGGRGFVQDKYDHVSIARRQPGSTFKPFVYTAAIDNGYSPYYRFPDTLISWTNPATGDVWSPGNASGNYSGSMTTLREGLAQSMNTITAQLILEIKPETVAFYAKRMGIESDLLAVPSLALGTSRVTLLELTSAYTTLASGGLHREPVAVTRIVDGSGNLLYRHTPAPSEAISEATAYTIVDMMRDVVNRGTGQRIRWQYGLTEYDFAGKTGTTQNSADGWFMLMHPELVTGAWVGFNDQRVTFRTNFWGQGAHNALFLAGDFWRSAINSSDVQINNTSFPPPQNYGMPAGYTPAPDEEDEDDDSRIGW